MRLRKFAPLLIVTVVAIFAAPVFPANADPTLSGLKAFQAECMWPTNSTSATCKGKLIGTATLSFDNYYATPLENLLSQKCYLFSVNLLLTTQDGSTLTFETSGTECVSAENYRRQNSYFITGGTGRFAGVTGGAGEYVQSGYFNATDNKTGRPATIHLDGNIQFP